MSRILIFILTFVIMLAFAWKSYDNGFDDGVDLTVKLLCSNDSYGCKDAIEEYIRQMGTDV